MKTPSTTRRCFHYSNIFVIIVDMQKGSIENILLIVAGFILIAVLIGYFTQ